MNSHYSLLKNISRYCWVFLLIFLIAFFLRTYRFHDFLRFNADQSRDAMVVSNVIDGKEVLPLLGPKAGGTNFRVGPAFYYFQIASAKIFGNAPDKMAYPDLLSSLLAIPLLFFFLRKYFDTKTALLLTTIFAVSFYAIKYSRFAWNPNSLPFWSILFLFSLNEIVTIKENSWKWWAIVTGIALGIGVQLHSLSLLLFPAMMLGVFGYLLYKKKENIWKIAFVICFISIFLNIPQIVSEIKTGGENTTAFFGGVGTKEKKGSGLIQNIEKNIVCFSQSSTYILSSYDSSDTCELKSISQGFGLPAFISGLLLAIGGFILTIRVYRKEDDYAKKVFLGIFLSFVSLTFLLLIPLANEVSMRFFLIALFMPFVFLGLWWNFIQEVFPKVGSTLVLIIGIVLIIMNIVSVGNTFTAYASYLTNSNKGMDNVLLKEVELASSFILAQSNGAKVVALDGDKQFLFKALKSMEYFTSKSGIQLTQKNKKSDPQLLVFLVENSKSTEKFLNSQIHKIEYLPLGRFTIFSLKQ